MFSSTTPAAGKPASEWKGDGPFRPSVVTNADEKKKKRGSRGNSGSLGRRASSGDRRPSMTIVDKAKAASCQRLQRSRARARELISAGYTRQGIRELHKTLAIQKASTRDITPLFQVRYQIEALWQCAEDCHMLLNNEAILLGASVEDSVQIMKVFREALQYVYVAAEDDPPQAPPKRQFSASPTPVPDYFASHPTLKSVLRAITFNNMAVQTQSVDRSLWEGLLLLLRAFQCCEGTFSTVILYNIAVLHTAAGRYDDALEALSCCMELAAKYLRASPMPAASATMEEHVTYSTFVSLLATHLVLCHHLVATIAVWHGDMDTELRQCALASECAAMYLVGTHPLQRRCANRQRVAKAKQSNASNGYVLPSQGPDSAPPQLPLLALGDVVASPCALPSLVPPSSKEEVAWVAGTPGAFTNSQTTAVAAAPLTVGTSPLPLSIPTVRISAMLEVCKNVKPPHELIAYKRTVNRQLAKAEKTHPALATGPVLPPISTSARSRSGTASMQKKSVPEEPSVLPEVLLVPRRPSVETPCTLTAIPRLAFNRYKNLKDATLSYLEEAVVKVPDAGLPPLASRGTGSAATRVVTVHIDDGQLTTSSRNTTALAAAPPGTITSTSGISSAPPEFMRVMDNNLLHFSQLMVDVVPEIKEASAAKIQRLWHCYSAHRMRDRKEAALQRWRIRSEAAHLILRAYRNYKACQPAIAERHALYEHFLRCRRVTEILRYVRQRESVEQWGRRCVVFLQKRLAKKIQWEREEAAATLIQAWSRMILVRFSNVERHEAAIVIQADARRLIAQNELRRLKVLHRLAYDRWPVDNKASIVYIQRWYLACKAREAVVGILAARQAAVQAYRHQQEDDFERNLKAFSQVPALGMAISRVMATLRGAHARRQMAFLHAHHQVMRRALTRWILRERGAAVLDQLRQERQVRLATQLRCEEVLDACLRLQAAARMWAAQRQLQVRLAARRIIHDSACAIQLAYRRYSARRVAAALHEARTIAEEVDSIGRRREASATSIQATWRMHRTRAAHAAYIHFMLYDRHHRANRIQRVWRAYRARRTAAEQRALLAHIRQRVQREHRRCTAAILIQSLVRMYLHRCRCVAALQPTVYARKSAARTIQAHWRGIAARQFVRGMALASAHFRHEKATQEALNVYATMIQAVVRGRILNHKYMPKGTPVPRTAIVGTSCKENPDTPPYVQTDVPSHTTEERCAAAVKIQSLWRGYLVRCVFEYYVEDVEEKTDVETVRSLPMRSAGSEAVPSEISSPELCVPPTVMRNFAVTKILSCGSATVRELSGHMSCSSAASPTLALAASPWCVQEQAAIMSQTPAEGAEDTPLLGASPSVPEEAVARPPAFEQVAGEGRPDVQTDVPAHTTEERCAAAVKIQSLWRGHAVRHVCDVEGFDEIEDDATFLPP